MGLSKRQRIIEVLLEAEYPLSVDEIAYRAGMDSKDVASHLDRIAEAMRGKGYIMEIEPARCKKCGYEFEPSLRIPSKCPRCHSQWLSPPRFRLVKAGK